MNRDCERDGDHGKESHADHGKCNTRACERRTALATGAGGSQAEEDDPHAHRDHAHEVRCGEALAKEEDGEHGRERAVGRDGRRDNAQRPETECGEDADICDPGSDTHDECCANDGGIVRNAECAACNGDRNGYDHRGGYGDDDDAE